MMQNFAQMKKDEVFTFSPSKGVEVTAVVVTVIRDDANDKWYLCYAQNRLFGYRLITGYDHPLISTWIDYAILPEYDKVENIR